MYVANRIGYLRMIERNRDLTTLAGDRAIKFLHCSVPVADLRWDLLNTCFRQTDQAAPQLENRDTFDYLF